MAADDAGETRPHSIVVWLRRMADCTIALEDRLAALVSVGDERNEQKRAGNEQAHGKRHVEVSNAKKR
jgi:hypothetical protein